VKILLIEDDVNLAELLQDALIGQNYVVDMVNDGQVGWELAEFGEYDLILLDRQLPTLDGITLCRRLRESNRSTLVMLITVQNQSSHKVEGLDAGADDYVVKPFDLAELLARIRALLRRSNALASTVLTIGELQLNPQSCMVTYAGQLLSLTSKEYGLLALFLQNPQRVFSQSALVDRLWSLEETPSENTVRAHIKGLRQKLKKAGCADVIETIYGIGYRLKAQANVTSNTVVESTNTPASVTESDGIAPELMVTWERYRERYYNRVAVIEQTILAIRIGTLTAPLLSEAQRETHTLIGSLGSFGLMAAAQLARQIDQQFSQVTLDVPLSADEMTALVSQTRALRQALRQAPLRLPAVPPVVERQQVVRLLIVDADRELAESLATACQRHQHSADWQLQVAIVTDLAAARAAITTTPPDFVLLDLPGLQPTDEAELQLLTDLSSRQPPIPVLVSTQRDEFTARVKVARLGAQGFLPKPITPTQIMAAIEHVLHRTRQVHAKLMAVDDDPQLLEALQQLLAPWGFDFIRLDDPRQFWHILQQVQPDLLILNIEMPTFDGIALCQALRNDQRWYNLPVMFLSAHTDLPTIEQAFKAGADDYVSKPIAGAELVSRVLNRLDRVQSLRGA
jgi:DNA-binding response OmpR family regulator